MYFPQADAHVLCCIWFSAAEFRQIMSMLLR